MPPSTLPLPRLLLSVALLAAVLAADGSAPQEDPFAGEGALRLDPPLVTLRQIDVPADSASVEAGGRDDALPWYHSGYGWQTPPPQTPDWAGAGRDTSYFLIYQLAVIGVLYTMPNSVTNWDKDELEGGRLAEQWWDNVTHPEWDEDKWWINYLAHPYWGATYYIRGRERGFDKTRSFLYSALLSTLYEFTFEAFAEPVSYQDFFFTPILGALLGEYVFSPIRERIRAQPGPLSWSDKTVLFLTDPLGVMSAWTDRMSGVQSRLTLQPLGEPGLLFPGDTDQDDALPPDGVRTAQAPHPWGLQWEVRW